jgi:RimJ/RimL family protein N-acetyltransferase
MLLRFAEAGDLEDLFSWRNDPKTREMSLIPSEVSMPDHEAWYRRKLLDDNCLLLIAEQNGQKIGVVRFDMLPELQRAEVSINLNPDFRGKRLSQRLLKKAVEMFRGQFDADIAAIVKENNLASRKIFDANGFIQVSNSDGNVRYLFSR